LFKWELNQVWMTLSKSKDRRNLLLILMVNQDHRQSLLLEWRIWRQENISYFTDLILSHITKLRDLIWFFIASLEKKEQLKRKPFWKQQLVQLNQCGNNCLQKRVWSHLLKWIIFKDRHLKVELAQEEFPANRWLQKWLVRPETSTYLIEEAEEVEQGQDLIQKNMKSNSFVFNTRVLSQSCMRQWKNSIRRKILSQEWENTSHRFGFVTRNKRVMRLKAHE